MGLNVSHWAFLFPSHLRVLGRTRIGDKKKLRKYSNIRGRYKNPLFYARKNDTSITIYIYVGPSGSNGLDQAENNQLEKGSMGFFFSGLNEESSCMLLYGI